MQPGYSQPIAIPKGGSDWVTISATWWFCRTVKIHKMYFVHYGSNNCDATWLQLPEHHLVKDKSLSLRFLLSSRHANCFTMDSPWGRIAGIWHLSLWCAIYFLGLGAWEINSTWLLDAENAGKCRPGRSGRPCKIFWLIWVITVVSQGGPFSMFVC